MRYINVNFKFCCFSVYFSRSPSSTLKEIHLILATQSNFFSNPVTCNWLQKFSFFRYQLCLTWVKLLAFSTHTAVAWKHHVLSHLFLFIHNMALLKYLLWQWQMLGLKNACCLPYQNPEPYYLPLLRLTFYPAIDLKWCCFRFSFGVLAYFWHHICC